MNALVRIGSGEGKIGEVFQRGIRFLMGDGKKVSFWKNIWAREKPLMEVFPRFFRVALNCEALISDYYREVNDVQMYHSGPSLSRGPGMILK